MDNVNYKRLNTLSYLSSFDFQIATSSIFDLYTHLKAWVLSGNCGAMVYGRSRVGKTSSILYCIKKFKQDFGESFPSIIWTLTEHAAVTKDKHFYASFLDAMDIEVGKYSRVTSLELKIKIVNYLAIKAHDTPMKTVVLFIDEAYKLDYKEYYWLMDIYNILHVKYNVKLIVFLFGTPREMKAVQKNFRNNHQTQINERFLLNEFAFSGIKDIKEMAFCLAELDKTHMRNDIGEQDADTLAAYFFPEAYKAGDGLFFNTAELFWEAFAETKIKNGISAPDIPMHYFMQAFIFCLSEYGFESSQSKYFISKREILSAIEQCGYGRTADE